MHGFAHCCAALVARPTTTLALTIGKHDMGGDGFARCCAALVARPTATLAMVNSSGVFAGIGLLLW